MSFRPLWNTFKLGSYLSSWPNEINYIFFNFSVYDMNRNILHRDTSKVDNKQIDRMNKYWGDNSWKNVAYSTEGNLFGIEETTNNVLARAFRQK